MADRQSPVHPAINAVPPKDAAENKSKEIPSATSVAVPEAVPPPPHQTETTTCRPDQTPWWKAAIEVMALAVAIWAGWTYWRQLNVMIGQLGQMQGSSDQTNRLIFLYQKQLEQLTRQADRTQTLADRTKDLADRMKDQADRTKSMSRA